MPGVNLLVPLRQSGRDMESQPFSRKIIFTRAKVVDFHIYVSLLEGGLWLTSVVLNPRNPMFVKRVIGCCDSPVDFLLRGLFLKLKQKHSSFPAPTSVFS